MTTCWLTSSESGQRLTLLLLPLAHQCFFKGGAISVRLPVRTKKAVPCKPMRHAHKLLLTSVYLAALACRDARSALKVCRDIGRDIGDILI